MNGAYGEIKRVTLIKRYGGTFWRMRVYLGAFQATAPDPVERRQDPREISRSERILQRFQIVQVALVGLLFKRPNCTAGFRDGRRGRGCAHARLSSGGGSAVPSIDIAVACLRQARCKFLGGPRARSFCCFMRGMRRRGADSSSSLESQRRRSTRRQ
jgi:hypothetical protein